VAGGGYGPRVTRTSVGVALRASFRAVRSESWIGVAGMVVALLRGALALPFTAFVFAVTWLAVREAALRGGRLEGVLAAVAGVWASPRARSIAIGLWLAGVLLWGALRVAWVAGAMPAVAWQLSGRPGPRPRNASGVAWRFAQVLPVAAVALLLDLAGRALVLLAFGGAFAIGIPVQRGGGSAAAAFVAAAGLTTALFLGACLSVAGDAAVARASMSGEGPGRALAGALLAVGRRPAAFLAAVVTVAIAFALATGSVEAVLGIASSVTARGPRWLALFPQSMFAVVTAFLAALAEAWRLGALGVLAASAQPGGEKRWMSLRSESLGMRPPSQ
jgi:hypothetical protein